MCIYIRVKHVPGMVLTSPIQSAMLWWRYGRRMSVERKVSTVNLSGIGFSLKSI
jgi:hypothetical protein